MHDISAVFLVVGRSKPMISWAFEDDVRRKLNTSKYKYRFQICFSAKSNTIIIISRKYRSPFIVREESVPLAVEIEWFLLSNGEIYRQSVS